MSMNQLAIDLALSGPNSATLDQSIQEATGGLFKGAEQLANFALSIQSGQIDKAISGVPGLDSFGGLPKGTLGAALTSLATGSPVPALAHFAKEALGVDLSELGDKALDKLGLGDVKDNIDKAISGAKDNIDSVIGDAKDALGKGLGGLVDGAKDLAENIADKASDVVGDIADAIGGKDKGGTETADATDSKDSDDGDSKGDDSGESAAA